MLSVEDALQQILQTVFPLSMELVPLANANRRVLASSIEASHDLPAFNNSSMDGYAVRAADTRRASADNLTLLEVIEQIPAGRAPRKTLRPGQAASIMTGAPMPAGADAVIPIELTETAQPRHVRILEPAERHAYVRFAGEDIQAGETILYAGHRLRPPDLGVLAGLGVAQVPVIRRPRVAILSTGDELLAPDEALEPGKIRDMNSYSLPAMVAALGAEPLRLGIARDRTQDVRRCFQLALDQNADLILSTAGVSVGALDVVKAVLDEMGKVSFWRVNMRPGKPVVFGHVGAVPFLGLPGNPVSAMVTFMVFARPIIALMQGLDPQPATQTARVGEVMTGDGRKTYTRVRLQLEDGEWVAYSTGTQSSGAISSMVKADGLLIIPAGVRRVEAGSYLEVWQFHQGV